MGVGRVWGKICAKLLALRGTPSPSMNNQKMAFYLKNEKMAGILPKSTGKFRLMPLYPSKWIFQRLQSANWQLWGVEFCVVVFLPFWDEIYAIFTSEAYWRYFFEKCKVSSPPRHMPQFIYAINGVLNSRLWVWVGYEAKFGPNFSPQGVPPPFLRIAKKWLFTCHLLAFLRGWILRFSIFLPFWVKIYATFTSEA